MKKLILAVLPFCALTAHADSAAELGVSQIDNLYVPQGFDDNDVVEVIVSGHFDSSCYQLGEARSEVNHETRTVTITPTSYKEEGVPCYQMVSPYTQVVKLGKMSEGRYVFKVTNNPQFEKALDVKRAQVSDRDDFLYPPVDFADVVKNPRGEPVLTLRGRYPLMKRGCMETLEARVEFQDGEILVVQPKAAINLLGGNENGIGCEAAYVKKYRLPFAVDGKILIHVRSINGQSYNRVEDVN